MISNFVTEETTDVREQSFHPNKMLDTEGDVTRAAKTTKKKSIKVKQTH